MATNYVQITRDEFEAWLNQAPWKWKRDPRYKGVYILEISKHVGVSIRSTVGESSKAVGKGEGSGAMRLVSLAHGTTLNKKAMGQKYFARTTNWRDNWKKGINRLLDAYNKSPSFYDALASIKDRDKYKADTLTKIEAIPNWQQITALNNLHKRVQGGGILTLDQMEDLSVTEAAGALSTTPVDEDRLMDLRKLWKAAQKDGDQWLMDFTKSIAEQVKAGRPLSQKQVDVVKRNLGKYRIASARPSRVAAAYLS